MRQLTSACITSVFAACCFLVFSGDQARADGIPATVSGIDFFEPDSSASSSPERVRVRHEAIVAAPGDLLRLNVQPAVSFQGRVTAASVTASGSRLVRGVISGRAGGSFLAVEHGSATAAAIWISPTERYALGGATIRALTGPSTARCACGTDAAPLRRNRAAPKSSAAVLPNQAAATATMLFDVLVVYTPAALQAEGSADAVAAQAELAMADANVCYENSGIPIQGRIADVRPVNYVESGEIRTDLHALAVPDDGVLDEVQPMRDQAEADFVCLFTNRASADGYQGFAEIMTGLTPDYEELAYSVINVKSAVIEHLFAHELGHNMGCDHDRENTTGLRLFDFSYGWRFTGSNWQLYRDVMAYPPGTSVAYFANPQVSYFGTPTGVADYADTARTIIASAPTFINFRAADGRGNVAVKASVPQASIDDKGAARASFRFERTGSVAQPLTVTYASGGTAAADIQYRALPGSLIFAAGKHYATVRVHGLASSPPFGAATVTLALQPGDAYTPAGDPATGRTVSAALTLLDRLPLVSVAAGALNSSGRKVRFPVARLGSADGALTVLYTVGGSAVAGVDYKVPLGSVTFAPGETESEIKIRRLTTQGGGEIDVQLTPDAAYNVETPGNAGFVLP